MAQFLACVALLVADYDEAIDYYTRVLGFELVEDTPMGANKRWVVVTPGDGQTRFLLARAVTPEQAAAVGNQAGGRVFLFLQTDNFWADYSRMRERGVHFCEQPREESYATVVVFADLYGNRWDLLQPWRGRPPGMSRAAPRRTRRCPRFSATAFARRSGSEGTLP